MSLKILFHLLINSMLEWHNSAMKMPHQKIVSSFNHHHKSRVVNNQYVALNVMLNAKLNLSTQTLHEQCQKFDFKKCKKKSRLKLSEWYSSNKALKKKKSCYLGYSISPKWYATWYEKVKLILRQASDPHRYTRWTQYWSIVRAEGQVKNQRQEEKPNQGVLAGATPGQWPVWRGR